MSEPKVTILERHWTTHVTKDDSFDGIGREFPLVRTVVEIGVDTSTHFRRIRVGPRLNLTNHDWWYSIGPHGPVREGFPLFFEDHHMSMDRSGKLESFTDNILNTQGEWLKRQWSVDTATGRYFRKVYANDLALHQTRISIRQNGFRYLLYGLGRYCRPLTQSKEDFKAEMEQLTVETVTEHKLVR